MTPTYEEMAEWRRYLQEQPGFPNAVFSELPEDMKSKFSDFHNLYGQLLTKEFMDGFDKWWKDNNKGN